MMANIILDGLDEFEEFLKGLGYGKEDRGIRYPINNTGYSEEKLCSQLPNCLKSKESARVFDEYCSGDYNKCEDKVLN